MRGLLSPLDPLIDADDLPLRQNRPGFSRADALVALARSFLERRRGEHPAASPGRYEVLVHLHDGDTCKLGDGTPILAETTLRLACDAARRFLRRSPDGKLLDAGRRHRTVSRGLRLELESRDLCCRYPGCGARLFLDAHHIEHWARGGATTLANLLLLCGYHHWLVHEGGHQVALRDGGGFDFFDKGGRRIDPAPRLPPVPGDVLAAIARLNAAAGVAVDPDALRARALNLRDWSLSWAVQDVMDRYRPPARPREATTAA